MRVQCRDSSKGLSSGIPTPPSLGSPIRFEQESPLSPASEWPIDTQYRTLNTCNDIPVARKLADANVLVLLTPLLPYPDLVGSNDAEDPFERMGRAISECHPRVRHLPYNPGAKPTVVHEECIKRAGAVVTVLYETVATESPMSIASLLNERRSSPANDHHIARTIDGQVDFARWVCDTLAIDNRHEAAVTVTIGPPKGKLDTCLGRQPFRHVVHCSSRTSPDPRAIAGAIFGKSPDDRIRAAISQLPSPINV